MRSAWRALAAVTADLLVIGLAAALAQRFDGVPAYLGAVLVIGTRQYALGECLAHEASHCNLSRHAGLNEALGVALCWPFFFTLGGYRRFHNRLHHKVPLADPANSVREDYADWGLPPATRPLGRGAACWHLLVKPILGIIGLRHLLKTVADFYWDRDLAENTAMLCGWALVVAAAASQGWLKELGLYWLLPWAAVFPVLNYWSEVGDHYRVSGAETRSNLSWAWNRLIAHNIGYHALHHRYPSIPWFRLPRAYGRLRGELTEQVSRGYIMTFRQIALGAD